MPRRSQGRAYQQRYTSGATALTMDGTFQTQGLDSVSFYCVSFDRVGGGS
ncbi:MAG: hypothetical protein M3Y28_01025 [Armatimonadota bacterium]|nr:hypothetical protein [Armatimonadota bacterium]